MDNSTLNGIYDTFKTSIKHPEVFLT
jgi:hypothetical protein